MLNRDDGRLDGFARWFVVVAGQAMLVGSAGLHLAMYNRAPLIS